MRLVFGLLNGRALFGPWVIMVDIDYVVYPNCITSQALIKHIEMPIYDSPRSKLKVMGLTLMLLPKIPICSCFGSRTDYVDR